MPFRDDSAGAYGQWINDPNQSWLNYTRMKADDIAQGTRNVVSSLAGAFNPVTPNVIKPRGTYPGGASYNVLDWQVPPLVQEPINALSRIVGSPQNPGSLYDMSGVPEFDAPMKQDGLTSLLSMYGGNALRLPGRAAGGAKNALLKSAFERSQEPPNAIGDMWQAWNRADPNSTLHSDTGKPSILGNALATAGEQPRNALGAGAMREAVEQQPVRAYRGFNPVEGRNFTPKELPLTDQFLFSSSSPDVAGSYAGIYANQDWITNVGAVAPVEMNFKNPKVYDARGSVWNDVDGTTVNHIADKAARDGHDGLIVNNVLDALDASNPAYSPATTYVALQRGTVKSPLTGETLFSDTGKPSILGNALAGAGEPQTVKAYHYSTDPTIGPKNKFYEWSHFGAADQAEDIFKGTASHANGEGSGATYPVELDIKNPFRIEDDGLNSPGTVGPHLWYMLDRAGYNPEQFYKMRADGTLPRALDDLLSQHGYDGLVYKNKFEGKGGKDSFIATRPNTVRSATTGETLFSDTGKPSIAGSALGANQNNLSIDDIVALYGR